MDSIITFLENITVEQIVSYISSIGIIITTIVTIIVNLKAKIKSNENIDIQAKIDEALTKYKAEMIKQMNETQQETIDAVTKSNQYVVDTVTEKQKEMYNNTQKQISAATIQVNNEIEMLKNIKEV